MLQVSVTGSAGAQQLNAAFVQGDDVSLALTMAINSTPVNLTGCSIKMTIATPTPLLLSTGNGGITVTDAPAGQFSINISSTTTAGMSIGTYPYDVWIEYQTSPPVENQYITGAITITKPITVVP
jgi:hypothetical protein